jgi:hypothetical protein
VALAGGRGPALRDRSPRPRSLTLVVVAAFVAVAAVTVVWWLPTRRSAPPGEPAAADPGAVHVHGLDMADGTLFAATHTGLFTLSDEQVRRVGGHYHDLMGFTIAAPDDFVASGHPDLLSDHLQKPGRPPLLGLVHSRDRGRTWRPVSLLGEVDFHALEVAHGRVYGWDATSGRFMTSPDRVNWQTRSTVALSDFVVDPADPSGVLAVTDGGVLRSDDGGRRWTAVARRRFVVTAWSVSGPVAVTSGGGVFTSDRRGQEWTRRGDLGGPPEALTSAGGTLYAAAAGRGVLASTDGGGSWKVRMPVAG